MKRKIITQKQLDRLVNLGVVKRRIGGYHSAVDCGILLDGPMTEELLGHTINGEKRFDEVYPFISSAWIIPSFILACNYKKMLAKAEEVRK